MFEIRYIDPQRLVTVVATAESAEAAIEAARAEAERRQVGRMWLAGSTPADCVVIVPVARVH